ncbi:Upc2 protein [Boeremia exigua]|uniref:Upc2 protein n=1 Tax=Boeremia exigua TaxID=749465 RepID=UPI001E8EA49C|nr:Upc2 protein [Boeremia exigua]KAH6615406.1 Upc2 protein [Boeremia exigua]
MRPESFPRRRRTHQKSKKGCSQCKARHIKCDEGRPSCAHCITTHRCCSFLQPSKSLVLPDSAAAAASSTRISSSHTPEVAATVLFTTSHLICLHHAETCMETYMALQDTGRPIVNLAIAHADSAPYLLSQMLALSALHLATDGQDTSKRAQYHQQATELQTRALEQFNRAQEESSDAKYIPVFVFASLLGMHVLKETLVSHQDSLSDFVDAFVHYTRLHRGVRTAITNDSWPMILESDLRPLLYFSDLSAIDKQVPGDDTLRLKEFIELYNAGPESSHACHGALERVQWMLDVCKQHPSQDNVGIHATMAWPLLVPEVYIDVLHQRRPEALAVLAFYAAALHRYRHFWVFRESGFGLLSAIRKSIGSYWQDSLDISVDTLFAT